MTQFTVKMNTDSSAFDECRDQEIARILRNIADNIENNGCSGFYQTIYDINGNDVGRYALKNDDGTNHNG